MNIDVKGTTHLNGNDYSTSMFMVEGSNGITSRNKYQYSTNAHIKKTLLEIKSFEFLVFSMKKYL